MYKQKSFTKAGRTFSVYLYGNVGNEMTLSISTNGGRGYRDTSLRAGKYRVWFAYTNTKKTRS